MNLDELFEENENVQEESVNPRLKIDWEKNESARVRLTQDVRSKDPEKRMKLMVRHYVQGIGFVECGQPQGLQKKGDEKVPCLWSTKFYQSEDDIPEWARPYMKEARNGYTAPACKFCHERSQFKQANGGDKMPKEKQKEFSSLHKRSVNLIAKGEAQLLDANGKEIGELQPKAIVFNAIDLFFPQQEKQYKQLTAKTTKKKGTLTKTWLTIDSQGQIDFDGDVSKEELKREVDVDLSYFDRQTKSYDDGLKIHLGKLGAAEEAEPMPEARLETELEDEDVF